MRITRLLPAALGIGTTVVALAAAPANAALTNPALPIQNGYMAASGCTLTSGASFNSTKTFQDDGVPVTSSGSSNQVITGGSASDTVSLAEHTKSTITVHDRAGQLSSFSIASQVSASAVPALGTGTGCSGTQAYGEAVPLFTFHVSSSGWITYHQAVSASGETYTSGTLYNTASGKSWSIGGWHAGSGTAHVRLSAGTYGFSGYAYAVGTANAPTTGAAKSSLTTTTTATLTPYGNATAGASGAGKPYVALPAAVNCGGHKAVAALTGQVTKASSVRFSVNGATKRTVNKPKKSNVTINGFPAQGDLTLTASVKLKSGATKTVTRSYAACS